MNVLVAMSGGVDSTIAAHALISNGNVVSGSTMLLCNNHVGALDAKRVCDHLGINHITLDKRDIFTKEVVTPFVYEYLNGNTPNPCVVCNKTIKFGVFLEYALSSGFNKIATGHYADIFYDNGSQRWNLKRSKDISKDQTYMLYSLSQHQLSHVLFPLGNYSKSEVRAIACDLGIHNAQAKDSQDICFVPSGNYSDFIEDFSGKKFCKGNFINENGDIIGEHAGIARYTIGQRKGLGIALGYPAYVYKKSLKENAVYLGPEEKLYSKTLTAKNVNLIATDKITSTLAVQCKTRYNQFPFEARVLQTDADEITVEFKAPQKSITPGQSVVLYDGDVVIGGGIIK